jgi:hypothetical protein
MMIVGFKLLYTIIREKIIGNRTWEETRGKINEDIVEDPIFNLASLIVRRREATLKEKSMKMF